MTPVESEGEAVRIVRRALPSESLLMVANSLPVRHIDAFCPSGGAALEVLSQRGVNGIDGLTAGAAGASVAAGRPVTLIIGDVSFQHDVGALALAATVTSPLVVVVLDNGGGRIFEMLPAGRRFGTRPVFDYFTTTPQVDIEALAAAFRLCHVRLDGTMDLAAALGSAYQVGAATVVQVMLPEHGARHVADAVTRGIDERFE